ncbi:DNA-3-methyladenine glycosylase [Fulvivirga lutimaris]|uniref:DNA-3-methyladenine glycosylase n=1 Tax=Fulvivirga lutimaris TaxID=1819566 RepID=UPI0012BD3EF6|nr:DNA-3-methyladenine glycosylase [Fulvivirga lutimaris]MTI40617.1 DNA-3-methyladenine glycosylase [Fulvivirga lutimaris]
MVQKKLDNSYYLADDVVALAKDLVGKELHVKTDLGHRSGIIVETEAYSYLEKGCHAYDNKRTARTEPLFMAGGVAYIYLCYGIHHLFNIVTNAEDKAEAVLIRAVQPNIGFEPEELKPSSKITSGPGKLSKVLGIDLNLNKISLTGDTIWLTDAVDNSMDVLASKRIGIDYAGEDANLLWRFTAKNSPWISKKI